MEEQKQELVSIIQSLTNPKLVSYLYGLIITFIELRS